MVNAVDANRAWIAGAIATLDEDRRREIDTPLLKLDLPELPACQVHIKDETAHPTGSLKHRLARSLFLHAICNGDIREGTTVVEASSGSTAISEAYFANLLKLPFIAVLPRGTATAKRDAIARAGAQIHLVDPADGISAVAARVARERHGHFMDQFTFAERATDWRGNNNIAESLFAQMAQEIHPVPAWVVVGAGTGGTSATIGRFIRYRPELNGCRLCVVDPEQSAFFAYFANGDRNVRGGCGGVIEGIGRACVEASFMRNVVDRMMLVPNAASIAGARWLETRLGRRFGPSTGTNIIGTLALAARMHAQGSRGSIATLACDAGDRYEDTIYDDDWLAARQIDPAAWQDRLARLTDDHSFGFDLEVSDGEERHDPPGASTAAGLHTRAPGGAG
ncbi:MAG TPA: PLP-dependent cysteine synthase family protein [Steroidobacteraceae bacterium]|jgi:cysteine synthase A|nr:PLP-dependent cysteine synthase family protein [Steroidobacteraceae bacterium]